MEQRPRCTKTSSHHNDPSYDIPTPEDEDSTAQCQWCHSKAECLCLLQYVYFLLYSYKKHPHLSIQPLNKLFILSGIGVMGNKCISQIGKGKTGSAVWNEEFRYRVEYTPDSPFLAKIILFEAHNLGADTPLYVLLFAHQMCM